MSANTGIAAVLAEQNASQARVVVESIAFPRADDNATAEYFGFYRRDCQSLIRRWLARTFAVAPTLPQSIETGVSCAVWFAESEIGRPLNAHELRLLGEAVRDWTPAHETLNRVERERNREIL